MDSRARNRAIRIIQSLDGLRRQIYWYLCRLTVQIAESEVDPDGNAIADLLASANQVCTSIIIIRYRILQTFFTLHPGLPLQEAENDYDPTGQVIFTNRIP